MKNVPRPQTRVYIFFFCLLLWSLVFGVAEAASTVELAATGPAAAIKLGSVFSVFIEMSATTEAINAIEGSIAYPKDILELTAVSDGGSVVNFWLDRASPENPYFSGIMAGGYFGERGRVLTLRFVAKEEGQGSIVLMNTKALKNDGSGTEAEVSTIPLSVKVRVNGVVPPEESDDRTPPEDFSLTIAQDPNLLDNTRSLIFSTQDKESGLDHYEVSLDGGPFGRAASPHPLSGDYRTITVRAFDRAGSVREVTWRASPDATYTWRRSRAILGGGLLLIIAILLGIRGISRRRYRRSRA